MEKIVKVSVIKKAMKCPGCDGEMEQTYLCYSTNPPKYEHKCNKCGYTEIFSTIYPRIEYVEEQ